MNGMARSGIGLSAIGLVSACVYVAPMVSQGDERRMMQVMSKSDAAFFARNDRGTWRRSANRVTFAHLYPGSCGQSADGYACLVTAKYGQGRTPGDGYLRSNGFAALPDGTRCFGFMPHDLGSSSYAGKGWVPNNFWLEFAQPSRPRAYPPGAIDRWRAQDRAAPHIASLLNLCHSEAQAVGQKKGQA